MRIGIDLGGTKTEGIVMDQAGEIRIRTRRPTPSVDGYEAVLQTVTGLVLDLERDAQQRCTVGIGTPGALSPQNGLLKNSNTTCLNGRPVQTDLERLLGRPVRIANDANCFALSEAIDGAGKGAACVFGVIMGTGVGGGLAWDGRLHAGLQQIAGEWGHNTLIAEGPLCYCGRRGCVETLISGPALARDYEANGGLPGLDAGAIVHLADHGDVVAEAAMRRFLERFGRALASVVNILDPHAIVLGGGLSHITRLYTDGRREVARHVFNEELLTPILQNVHGDSSGVRGAAQLWAPDEQPAEWRLSVSP